LLAAYKPGGAVQGSMIDVYFIRLNQFFEFVADCGLATANCDIGQISNIWAIVDAVDSATKTKDPFNEKGALNRHEWLQVLVRLAVRTQLPQGGDGQENYGDVAAAVDSFCEHLEAVLPTNARLDHNKFRYAPYVPDRLLF
jgi:hypothetical protein